MPYQFPEGGAGGWGGASGTSENLSPMNRGGLLYELGRGDGYTGGGGVPPPRQSGPPQLPPLPLGTGYGRGGAAYGAQGLFAGGAHDDPYDPWAAAMRRLGGPAWPMGLNERAGWNQYGSPGNPLVGFRGKEGSVSGLDSFYNLLMGTGADGPGMVGGSMFDPTGNYAPYLDSLQMDANRNTGAMLDRSRLRSMLDPSIDPSQRSYAGLLGESSSFGGAQDMLSQSRRGLADRNQQYLMDSLRQLYGTQTEGHANPFVDWNLVAKQNRPQDKGGGWGGLLGGLGGAALGSFLGPAGTAAGGALGKKLFG